MIQFDIFQMSWNHHVDMDVSENGGTPKSSILIGISIINHPFWGPPSFGNTHIVTFEKRKFSFMNKTTT